MQIGQRQCTVSIVQMASMMDSVPVFQQRMLAIGVDTAALAKLMTKNVNTLSKLAYCANYNPTMADDVNLVEFFTRTIHGPAAAGEALAELDAGLLAALRRGFFEAHTMMPAELKSRIERTEDAAPRKVPTLEKAARLADQQRRLAPGLDIAGPLQPAHSLIDVVGQQKEEDQLKAAESCPSRDDELHIGKKTFFADVSTDLKIRQALQRRSLAYDQLGIIAYEKLEAWISFLFLQPSRTPPDNYAPISMQQVLQADKQSWVFMSEKCRTGLAMTTGGIYLAEAALDAAKLDPMVMATLQPLPKHSKSTQVVKPVQKVAGKVKHEAKPKSKGKGKGKEARGPAMPKGLIGMHAKTDKGEPLCFGFNLGTCIKCQPGSTCNKGLHVCCKCFGLHPQLDCH